MLINKGVVIVGSVSLKEALAAEQFAKNWVGLCCVTLNQVSAVNGHTLIYNAKCHKTKLN